MKSAIRSKEETKKFKARRCTAFKKASELSTLCGVDVALIMYHLHDPKPDVWCSRPDSIHSLLAGNSSKYPSHFHSLGAQELADFDCFLAGKLDQVNDMITLNINEFREEKGTDVVQSAENYNNVFDEGFNLDDLDFDFDFDSADQLMDFDPSELVLNENDVAWFNNLMSVNEYNQASALPLQSNHSIQ